MFRLKGERNSLFHILLFISLFIYLFIFFFFFFFTRERGERVLLLYIYIYIFFYFSISLFFFFFFFSFSFFFFFLFFSFSFSFLLSSRASLGQKQGTVWSPLWSVDQGPQLTRRWPAVRGRSTQGSEGSRPAFGGDRRRRKIEEKRGAE